MNKDSIRRILRWLFSKVGDKLVGLIVPLVILLVWEEITRLNLVKPLFLPPPGKVVSTFFEMLMKQELLTDFKVSMISVVKGFLWGATIGLIAGILAGLSRIIDKLFGPTLNAIRQIPSLAWLPLIILWFGIGDLGKTIVIAKSVFFPVFLNTFQGVRNIPREYIEISQVFEFNRLRLLSKVVIPGALPMIFVGIRYGAGMSWHLMVAAEMLGGRNGLGFLLTESQEMLLTDQLFVVMAVIGFVGYFIDLGLKKLEKYFLRWKKT